MIELVKDYIEQNTAPMTLFVLKGFPLDALGIEQAGLQNTINNKIMRLIQLAQQELAVISFDEFVCLYDLAVAQFQCIHVIENPLYHNLYPVGVVLDDSVSRSLLAHFDEDVDENTVIGVLEEYTNVYSMYMQTTCGITCGYYLTESQLIHSKIVYCSIPVPETQVQQSAHDSERHIRMSICNDEDYYELVQRLQASQEVFAITWDNFVAGKEAIEKYVYRLCSAFPCRIFASAVLSVSPVAPSYAEATAILKKYWEHESFRNLKFYDLAAAAQKQKKVVEVSQGQIINDIIQQAENCVQDIGEYRDVFVTASTGAGKSLMFQIPAIYLAEKYNLLTIVISPLIGLMNDQVENLSKKGYGYVRTINGDISPVIKEEISGEVKEGNCHILYLSPESLLARSDIVQLIGDRRIGMVVVDEAHIVTTWGKQFRPDYWFLGDHVRKIFKAQLRKYAHGFITATFTATAIYEGDEDMYHETLNSLHMIDPITYLGYVRRENISIDIREVETKRNKLEYETDKFEALVKLINAALRRNQKMLIYFPTIPLITQFYSHCYTKNLSKYVACYHGKLDKTKKDASFADFKGGTKMVMLVTKAFGMGIDIEDIAIVVHFAPTGNVCDYMQEIGRAARRSDIDGQAIYRHMSTDFKHMNRLHGLSAIQKWQLVKVMGKILEIYQHTQQGRGRMRTKSRNAMLVDAESFAYIFKGPGANNNDSDLINKLKTALLLIQKDYKNQLDFSPFDMRPIPVFSRGFFALSPMDHTKLNSAYPFAAKLVHAPQNIYDVDLNAIWERSYRDAMSFPQFKFMLYTGNADLDFNQKYRLVPAMEVNVFLDADHEQIYSAFLRSFKKLLNDSARSGSGITVQDMFSMVQKEMSMNRYQAEGLATVVLAAIDIFQREYNHRTNSRVYTTREAPTTGIVKYGFSPAIRDFFSWLERGHRIIIDNLADEKIYVVNDGTSNCCKELTVIMGVLESAGVLRFRSLGGSQSQVYIYINHTRQLQEVKDKPSSYKNHLLELIEKRHIDSVRMLRYLFESGFSSDEIWEHLENYFLGILPPELEATPKDSAKPKKKGQKAIAASVHLIGGQRVSEDYSTWTEFNEAMLNHAEIAKLLIPLADKYSGVLAVGEAKITALLVWEALSIAVTDGAEPQETREIAARHGWTLLPIDELRADALAEMIGGNADNG